jgi:hypothetical protein
MTTSGSPTSAITATFTINGVSVPISGVFGDDVEGQADSTPGEFEIDGNSVGPLTIGSTQYFDNTGVGINFFSSNPDAYDFRTPLSVQIAPSSGDEGFFNYGLRSSVNHEVSVDFTATALTVIDVPEPRTWTLIILGVGLIGAVGRARRSELIAP